MDNCKRLLSKILMVDDDKSVREGLVAILRRHNHCFIETAESVSDAIWKFTENHFDLLI